MLFETFTTLFLSVGYCAFVDAEHALDPSLAEIIGVKTDNLLLAQPDSGEQALSLVDTLIRSGSVDVVVVDSVSHCYLTINSIMILIVSSTACICLYQISRMVLFLSYHVLTI
jgi:recA bacterial DNA recombination protein